MTKKEFCKELFSIIMIVAVFWSCVFAFVFWGPIKVEPIMSGSMEPEYMTNSLVVVNTMAQFDDIEVGDVIAFEVPDVSEHWITHRVKSKGQDTMNTKGDALERTDRFGVTRDNFRGKVIGNIDIVRPFYDWAYQGKMIDAQGEIKEQGDLRVDGAIAILYVILVFLSVVVVYVGKWIIKKKHSKKECF